MDVEVFHPHQRLCSHSILVFAPCVDSLGESCKMSSDNQFIYPGPAGDFGDYSSAILVQYGSPQEFNWTTNYDFGLDLVLWQETAEARIETLAGTIPPCLDFNFTPRTEQEEAELTDSLLLFVMQPIPELRATIGMAARRKTCISATSSSWSCPTVRTRASLFSARDTSM